MNAGTPVRPSGGPVRLLFVKLPHWIMGSTLLIGIAINIANFIARYPFAYSLVLAGDVLF